MNVWPQLRPAEEHIHEIGKDTSRCPNCSLAEYERRLTEFERFCLNWYQDNVTSFTVQVNILGEIVKELNLKGIERKLFFKALNMIYEISNKVSMEKQKTIMEKK